MIDGLEHFLEPVAHVVVGHPDGIGLGHFAAIPAPVEGVRHLVAEASDAAVRAILVIVLRPDGDAPSDGEPRNAALVRLEEQQQRKVLVAPLVAGTLIHRPAYLAGEHLQLLADVVLVRPLALRLRRTIVVNDLERRRRGHREKSCKRQNGEFHGILLSAHNDVGDNGLVV